MITLVKSTFYKESKTKKELIKFIKNSTHLSFGKECQRFENKFARYQQRKNCVFVNSGSSANLALIQALLNLGRIKKGDNVGFSALTWSTNVMPIMQLGLNPVPIDVELDTLNVSSTTLEKTIKRKKIELMFLTNLLGFCDDIDKVRSLCREKGIILLEDNCEGLGTVYNGKKLGNYGLASTFSFYVGHHMSTIEGGAICTDDEELAEQLKLVRAHGWDRNLPRENKKNIRNKFKINSTFYSRYTFYDLGYNLRPTEIAGFIGNTQVNYLDDITRKRNRNFLKIAKVLYVNDKFYPIRYDHMDFHSNFAVPVVCKSRKTRDELIRKCNRKIEIRPIVGGDMTTQPFFSKYSKDNYQEVKNARTIHDQGLYFGNNPELTNEEIKYILDLITSI